MEVWKERIVYDIIHVMIQVFTHYAVIIARTLVPWFRIALADWTAHILILRNTGQAIQYNTIQYNTNITYYIV